MPTSDHQMVIVQNDKNSVLLTYQWRFVLRIYMIFLSTIVQKADRCYTMLHSRVQCFGSFSQKKINLNNLDRVVVKSSACVLSELNGDGLNPAKSDYFILLNIAWKEQGSPARTHFHFTKTHFQNRRLDL